MKYDNVLHSFKLAKKLTISSLKKQSISVAPLLYRGAF